MSNVRIKNRRLLGLLVLGTALIWGCVRAPQKRIEEATAAFEAAEESEAGAYAPDAFASAEDAFSNAMVEVEEQNQKIAFLRSYDRASELLTEATQAATLAQTRADARREEMKLYTDDLIKDAQHAVVSARDAVKKLSRERKVSLSVELETANETLFDAEQAWKQGEYLAARDKAEDAKATADDVLENASAKRG